MIFPGVDGLYRQRCPEAECDFFETFFTRSVWEGSKTDKVSFLKFSDNGLDLPPGRSVCRSGG